MNVFTIESSQPLGAPGDPFSQNVLILNVDYMPTNSLRGIFQKESRSWSGEMMSRGKIIISLGIPSKSLKPPDTPSQM